jgi:acyl-CoA synthetase (NDP forming)
MAADACAKAGLNLTCFSPETTARLKKMLPPHNSCFNPVDLACGADEGKLNALISAILEDQNTHALLLLLSSTMPMEVKKKRHSHRQYPCMGKYPGKPDPEHPLRPAAPAGKTRLMLFSWWSKY